MNGVCRLRDATWVLGDLDEAILRWMRKQVQSWVPGLSGVPARFADKPGAGLSIVVGTPLSNHLICKASDQGLIDLVSLGGDEFILKQTVLDGATVLLIAGGSPRGAVYGVCELFEQLGCTFVISGDHLPPCDPEMPLPLLDLAKRTASSWRGIFFGGYCFTTNSMMSLSDYGAMFDQMVKLKMNRIVFYHFENEPFIDFSFMGERKLVGDISHPDSGYISYGRHFTGSFRVDDLPVGRERFDRAKIAPLEFQEVGSSDEALNTAKVFMREVIALAKVRGIGVWTTVLPQFIPPNLSKYSRPMPSLHKHWSAHLSCTDPAAGPINRARIQGILDAYPDLEGIFLGIPEGFFDDPYPETQALIESEWENYAESLDLQRNYWGKFWQGEEEQKAHIRADIAFTEIVKTTIAEAKRIKPDLKLGICTVCKAYLLTHLHDILPLDMPFIDIESRALWTLDGAPLHLFQRMKGRECAIIPRAVDDGSLLGLQFPLWQYSKDGFVTSAKENGTNGLMIQMTHIRGNEHSIKYLADGMWEGPAAPGEFYHHYTERVFGAMAAPQVMDAFAILEHNDEFLGGRGQHNMPWNMVPDQIWIMHTFRDFDQPFHRAPFSQDFVDVCEERAVSFRQAIGSLTQALGRFGAAHRVATRSGQKELAYLMNRTHGYRAHLQALVDFAELYRQYFELFALLPRDLKGFKQSLERLLIESHRLEVVTRESAGYFASCVEHTTDLALLWMVSHKMVLGSQCLRQFLENIQAYYDGREYWKPVDWDKLFGCCVFPPHGIGTVAEGEKTSDSEPG